MLIISNGFFLYKFLLSWLIDYDVCLTTEGPTLQTLERVRGRGGYSVCVSYCTVLYYTILYGTVLCIYMEGFWWLSCFTERLCLCVTSPAAGRGCWCSSRWLAGRSRRWRGCMTGSLRSMLCSTPCACDPARTHKVYYYYYFFFLRCWLIKHYHLPYHSVAARQSGQPHSAHVEQSHLPIVVWQSDDPLVGRDAYPERADCV